MKNARDYMLGEIEAIIQREHIADESINHAVQHLTTFLDKRERDMHEAKHASVVKKIKTEKPPARRVPRYKPEPIVFEL